MQLDAHLQSRLQQAHGIEAALDDAIRARAFAAALVALPAAIAHPSVARRVGRLLDDATGAELVTLDRAARTGSVMARLQLRAPALLDVAQLAHLGDDATGPAVVLSLVRDGRVREAATAQLARDESGLATRALFIRLDDTVPAVAARAAAGMERRLVPERAAAFSRALDLLDATSGRRSTVEGARLRGLARDLLLADDPRCRAAVDEALRSPHAPVRAAAARFAVLEGSNEQRMLEVFEKSLADRDPRARLWAARRVCLRETPVGVVKKLAPILARDPLPSVRVLAVVAGARVGAGDVLDGLTVDPNGGVRARARAGLGRAGGDLERERVRGEIAAGVTSVRAMACLAALSEIGRPDDFPWVAPFLHDARPRVQAEAMRALVGVHASGGLDAFVDVLHDKLVHESARVVHEAARGLALVSRDQVRRDVVTVALSRAPLPRRLRAALEALLATGVE